MVQVRAPGTRSLTVKRYIGLLVEEKKHRGCVGEHGAVFILGFFMGSSTVYYLSLKDEVT